MVKQKKFTQCSINSIGIRFAGRSESLQSFRVVPRALARLYKTLDRPHDFRCSIADKASFRKSAGTVTLEFDMTYDVYTSEMVVS